MPNMTAEPARTRDLLAARILCVSSIVRRQMRLAIESAAAEMQSRMERQKTSFGRFEVPPLPDDRYPKYIHPTTIKRKLSKTADRIEVARTGRVGVTWMARRM